MSHDDVSPPQAELTRREVNGLPNLPDVETLRGQQHVGKAGDIQRHGGWIALQNPYPMAKARLLER